MGQAPDQQTRDLISSRPKLVEDVVCTPHACGLEVEYHLEARAQGQFFRVGYAEYFLLSQLDGQTSVAQALTITARKLGPDALSQSQALQVIRWLLENRLARFADRESDACDRGVARATNGNWTERINPFWMKVPLGSPDRWLESLTPGLGWMFSAWACVAGMFLIATGVMCVTSRWSELAISARQIWIPQQWILMGLVWIVLKALHELAHGVACKRFGGEVRQWGLVFILLAPLAYVDVTSCWRFRCKWKRIYVAAAGMYAELLIAAVAAIAWIFTDSLVVRHLLFQIMLLASLSTLLFNANPLLRFDGYYILSDLLGIANLASEGRRAVQRAAAAVFLGARSSTAPLGVRGWVIFAYGLASGVWRFVVLLTLIAAAAALFRGAGLVLALLAAFGWFVLPIWRLAQRLALRFQEQPRSAVRAVSVTSCLVVCFSAVLQLAPWPAVLQAPAIVDYADRAQVRCETPGFVRRVCVTPGQQVQSGQILIELDNEELRSREQTLRVRCRQAEVRRRTAINRQDAAQVQIADRDWQALREQLAEIERRTAGLQIRAPRAGCIVARQLKHLPGVYLREGDPVLAVADERQKELVLSVAQADYDALAPLIGQPVRFRIAGQVARWGGLQRLEPRASRDLPHPALGSTAGGPLSIQRDDRAGTVRLMAPRFRGVVRLGADDSRQLAAGQRGYASFGFRTERLGEVLWIRARRYWEDCLAPHRALGRGRQGGRG